MEHLQYGEKLIYMEGIIVEITDGAVSVDLKGRLGHMKLPMRMLISNYQLELGQEVGFMMSYPEVLSEEQNEKYIKNMSSKNKLKGE